MGWTGFPAFVVVNWYWIFVSVFNIVIASQFFRIGIKLTIVN